MEPGREILIVEDDPATSMLLAALSRYCGFEPTAVDNGEAALATLAARTFDVVLLDLLLPHTNGFELLRHMKCTSAEMLQRTIVMTAAGAMTTRDCAELDRVWKFVRKPLEIEELALQIVACAKAHAETRRTSDPQLRPLVPRNDATAR
jgi:DNA-binding response OmpR family regulator